MWEMRSQLEDLAFPYVYPKEYYWLLLNVEERYEERKKYLNHIQPRVTEVLEKENIRPVFVDSRAKHYWSLYRKLLRYQMDFDQIYDFVALRIILTTTSECYKALGILHLAWRPIPGRIKDYIAFPKPNGYQSLHTTVLCEGGKITEFQLRTNAMHEEAEFGAAAQWAYKEHLRGGKTRAYSWVKQLSQWQDHAGGSKEFFENLKIDFFRDRIFVFTPKGDIIDLPEDASPVDFAYNIHSDLGNHCTGAKINGRMTALDTPLKNGDQVEIIITKTQHPNRDWLDFVKTNLAKSHIRKWLRSASHEQNLILGKRIIERELKHLKSALWDAISAEKKNLLAKDFKVSSPEHILIALGNGDLSPKEVIGHLFKTEEVLKTAPQRFVPKLKDVPREIYIAGEGKLLYHIAKCCNPTPAQQIVAFITKTHGAAIHKEHCPDVIERQKEVSEKVILASWQSAEKSYLATIRIQCENRIGLLRDVAATCSNLGVNIAGSSAVTDGVDQNTSATVEISIEIPNIEKLETLLNKLEYIRGVFEVKRV